MRRATLALIVSVHVLLALPSALPSHASPLPALPDGGPHPPAQAVSDVAAVVCTEEFSWPCSWALDTVWCESNDDPGAYNPAGPYVGWWQVLNGSWDPYENTLQAHEKYTAWARGEVPNPWPVCGR